MEYRPEFTLTAEGNDITAVIASGLVSIKLTDHGGATGKSDELQFTLASESLTLPSKGVKLRFGLGFNGEIQDKGMFVVNEVQSSGPPRKLVISATAAPMNAEKHDGNVISQKTRSFDGVTLGEVVNTIATEHGLKGRVADALSGIALPHIAQVRESDAALLTRLAKKYGAVSKPSGGYWMFLAKGDGTSASGGALADITVELEEVSSWSYEEGSRCGTSVPSGGSKKKGTIAVDYFSPATGKTETLTSDHDGHDVAHPHTQSSLEAAKSAIKAKKTQSALDERKMTLTCPGRPKHIPLTAECRVTTRGFGVKEDHAWLVESIDYSLSSTGLVVSFSLSTDIKPKSKGKAETVQDDEGDDDGALRRTG